jgi:hypothetical protein
MRRLTRRSMEGRVIIIMRRCLMKRVIKIKQIGRKNMDIYKIMKKMVKKMACHFLLIHN